MQKDVLVLRRVADKVYFDDKELTIVAQATKGLNKEVVKIDGLPNSHGQKYVSLAKLSEGLNTLSCKAREAVTTQSYSLTAEEVAEVKKLEARIAQIKDAAKARYVAKPNMNFDPSKMTQAEREAKYAELKKYFNL